MCNVPDEVREWIVNYVDYQEGLAWLEDDYKCRDDLLDDVVMMREWLDSLPTIPQADWSTAPEWADSHVIEPSGRSWWWAGKPIPTDGQWSGFGRREFCEHGSLPRGIDWRLTLQRRPDNDEGNC